MSGAVGALVWNKTITLTNAQIKALPSTPVEIIPAQGANRIIFPVESLWYAHIVGAYTNVDTVNGYLVLGTADDNVEISSFIGNADPSAPFLHNFLGIIGDWVAFIPIFPGITWGTNPAYPFISSASKSNIVNVGISLLAPGNSGNFTAGNALNTLTLTVFYRVIEL